MGEQVSIPLMRHPTIALIVAACALPLDADAFCGFYIDSRGEPLFAEATHVVLMRHGTRTALAMQNHYRGPVEDFALVVPVPVVLHRKDVELVTNDVFTKVDAMGAPRLVEYWEQDPCKREDDENVYGGLLGSAEGEGYGGFGFGREAVTVEDQFEIGEYNIVILSATESTALDRWLRGHGYQIPKGAEPLLRPYVEEGSKFFVAKVDPAKVEFVGGRAKLSPLRFSYDSERFALPIRLGLVNANATTKQDLIISILATDRYAVANYPNAVIPTNLDVTPAVRDRFGEFYASLFDRTVANHPGAVITEYAWDAESCDPCPGPELDDRDFTALGASAIGANDAHWVLTRLHARYDATTAPNDMVFARAVPLVGGREERDPQGRLESGARPARGDEVNNFQARFAIRHPWTGPIKCAHPKRGVWGNPPQGVEGSSGSSVASATDTAFVARGQLGLENALAQDVPELGIVRPQLPAGSAQVRARGCGCSSNEGGAASLLGAVWVALMVVRKRHWRAAQ